MKEKKKDVSIERIRTLPFVRKRKKQQMWRQNVENIQFCTKLICFFRYRNFFNTELGT